MLAVTVVGDFTKGEFNKLMGWKAADVPKEDKEAGGVVVEFAGESNCEGYEGHLVWLPEDVYMASYTTDVSPLVVKVAQNPSVYGQLSPKKQKLVAKLVKEAL